MPPVEPDAPSAAAPIIVSALLGPADLAWADGLRRAHFPPERNQLVAHLTLFHHLPPGVAAELDGRLRAATAHVERPQALVDRLLPLGRGTALGVRSPALATIRAELADAFAGCLTPQDRGGWRPHITIQNKVSPAEAKALLARLSAGFVARPIAIVGLASHYYRGGPWETIRRYRFSG